MHWKTYFIRGVNEFLSILSMFIINFQWNLVYLHIVFCWALVNFMKTSSGKAVLFQGCKWNNIYECSVKLYDIFKVKNDFIKSVYIIAVYTICNLIFLSKVIPWHHYDYRQSDYVRVQIIIAMSVTKQIYITVFTCPSTRNPLLSFNPSLADAHAYYNP